MGRGFGQSNGPEGFGQSNEPEGFGQSNEAKSVTLAILSRNLDKVMDRKFWSK